MNSKWMVYAKKADFKQIASEYGIDQVLARIIRNRDICGSKDIDMYLNGNLNDIHNPHSMKDADKFVDIITKKIEEHKPVRIIGDYDIDGICSIYILFCGLKAAGADVDYVVPHRINDGYGINEHLIDNAINEGIDTIVTCDNGIAAYNQVRYAKDNGITMIVTDHHDVPFEIKDDKKVYIVPPADAVINPKQADCDYPFKLLCGAGVAYKLISLLYDRLGFDKKELEDYIEFMAIATVGDIVDLIDENRIVVKYGLKHIAHTKNTGLRALIEECQLDINNISSYHIGFVIGPCLNASGRLDTARQAIELMLCKDNEKAHNMAKELIALNNERKSMTEQETQKAIELVENTGLLKDRVLVIYLKDCHESIAGIIAGRIKERYYRPTFVITNAEDGAKGSGRSIEGYNMYEEINKCKNKKGGEPVQREDLEEVYREHAQTVYGFLLLRTHDPQLAEELTQETFYQALRSLHKFDHSAKVSTWLCAIAKNVLRKYWQKEKKYQQQKEAAVNENVLTDSAEKVAGEEKMMALLHRLHTLPDKMREVIYLRLAADLSYRQIGEIMGQSENWARVTYYRGKEKLLEEEEKWES